MSLEDSFVAPFLTRGEYKKFADHYNNFAETTINSFHDYAAINNKMLEGLKINNKMLEGLKNSNRKLRIFIRLFSVFTLIQLVLILKLYI